MNKSALGLIGAIAIAFSGGCTSYVENQASLEFDPIYLAATPQPDAVVPTGAIYKASSQGLFATDIRARGVGDILTVALAETFTATKSQSTSSSKADGFDIDLPVGVPNLLTGGENFRTRMSSEGNNWRSRKIKALLKFTNLFCSFKTVHNRHL